MGMQALNLNGHVYPYLLLRLNNCRKKTANANAVNRTMLVRGNAIII